MDGEMLKYMIYLWMLAVAGAANAPVSAECVRNGAAAYAAAQYLGSMTA